MLMQMSFRPNLSQKQWVLNVKKKNNMFQYYPIDAHGERAARSKLGNTCPRLHESEATGEDLKSFRFIIRVLTKVGLKSSI